MRLNGSVMIFFVCVILFAACKKDKNDNCKLIPSIEYCNLVKVSTITYDNGKSITTFFEYDSKNRLVKQTRDTFVAMFSYPDERTMAMTSTYDGYDRKWIIGDDSRVSEYSISGDDTVIQKFFYDVNGFLQKSITIQYDGITHGHTDTNDYNILVKDCNAMGLNINDNDYKQLYTYYEEHPNNRSYPVMTGDYHAGYQYSVDLIKQIDRHVYYGLIRQSFSYEFDSKGRIAKETEQYESLGFKGNNFTSVTTYKYMCD